MDLKINDKVVLITGAAGMKGSIGETILQSLVKEGAIPIVLDRNERGFEYMKKIHEDGFQGVFLQTDLTDPDATAANVKKGADQFGRIDVVINNVGVNDGAGLTASYESFMNSLKLNLVSYFVTVKAALPWLKKSKGNIMNIGSKVSMTGQGGTSGYAASKGGVLALTREWAVDLINDGIRVNCLIIAESWTPAYETWINSIENGSDKLESIKRTIPFGNRMTTPEEIANQVLFTISDCSSHTTGQYIFVDGGYAHLDRALLPNNNN